MSSCQKGAIKTWLKLNILNFFWRWFAHIYENERRLQLFIIISSHLNFNLNWKKESSKFLLLSMFWLLSACKRTRQSEHIHTDYSSVNTDKSSTALSTDRFYLQWRSFELKYTLDIPKWAAKLLTNCDRSLYLRIHSRSRVLRPIYNAALDIGFVQYLLVTLLCLQYGLDFKTKRMIS